MNINDTTEKRFESDIEYSLITDGGFTKGTDVYDPKLGLFKNTFINFIKETQPKEWLRFERANSVDPEKKFCVTFNNACDTDGLLSVLRKGFKHRGVKFRVCYFQPESSLSTMHAELYRKNVCEVYRQWFYSDDCNNSVDMVLVLNGIPVFAFELKNQYTGQNVDNAKKQWMYDRDKREICFQFNKRILGYFAVDHTDVYMTTKLDGKDTFFLPFNQGSNGAGHDGGRGNPANPEGYPTSYLWEYVFRKDSMMDILNRFLSIEKRKSGKQILIFPRYHQLDVVRKLLAHVKENGPGHNYLIQHSAGSGKSNSIAWTAYRLASLHDSENNAVFSSVIVVTDRTVLDAQLQETINGFDHTLGAVVPIGEDKTSKDLRDAINSGARLIVTTLQKFPVIYKEVDAANGRNFAIIVDEAHSSQTGSSALKMKAALADTKEALEELAEIEGKAEEEIDSHDPIVEALLTHGRHKNLSYFAFTATPKAKTLEIFGTPYPDGSFHPFHIYSMRQAIEEGFILDVLQNYMTYKTCYKIAKETEDNPELPPNRTTKIIKKYQELHPTNISQKTEIIVETFLSNTKNSIDGRGKMMVVASSRLGAVKYFHEIKRYAESKGYKDVRPLVAFSGTVDDGGNSYTESGLNVREDGSHISEAQTKAEFHEHFNILVVAEKYQTGFDEPLLHTMIVDKKLKNVKAVQTLSRLNRTCPGKTDTFVLDFVNESDDILAAFQPFYQETSLSEEVNADLIYKVQKDLRNYCIYSNEDIDAFIKVWEKSDSMTMGKMTSALIPVVKRYNQLDSEDRYQIRRKLRSFCRWYSYLSQIIRMFDAEMHKEYLFCGYLEELCPADKKQMIDLDDKLGLVYYKLTKTFAGQIELLDDKGEYPPVAPPGDVIPEKDEPLEEIIRKINERYKGQFTEADKVMIAALRDRLLNDEKLVKRAKSADPKVFLDSIFPKAFEDAAHQSFDEAQESYITLFEDNSKYKAMMSALAEIVYREMRREKDN